MAINEEDEINITYVIPLLVLRESSGILLFLSEDRFFLIRSVLFHTHFQNLKYIDKI